MPIPCPLMFGWLDKLGWPCNLDMVSTVHVFRGNVIFLALCICTSESHQLPEAWVLHGESQNRQPRKSPHQYVRLCYRLTFTSGISTALKELFSNNNATTTYCVSYSPKEDKSSLLAFCATWKGGRWRSLVRDLSLLSLDKRQAPYLDWKQSSVNNNTLLSFE